MQRIEVLSRVATRRLRDLHHPHRQGLATRPRHPPRSQSQSSLYFAYHRYLRDDQA